MMKFTETAKEWWWTLYVFYLIFAILVATAIFIKDYILFGNAVFELQWITDSFLKYMYLFSIAYVIASIALLAIMSIKSHKTEVVS